MNTYESLKFCNGAHNNKNIEGWETLYEFNKTLENSKLDAKVYKKNNRIILAFSGTYLGQSNDIINSAGIFMSNKIPTQYKIAENLFNKVQEKYPKAHIEFTGYSLGGTISNLLAHYTGLPSTAIAPIGTKHIVNAHPTYFKYDDSKIQSYGRKSDYFLFSNK